MASIKNDKFYLFVYLLKSALSIDVIWTAVFLYSLLEFCSQASSVIFEMLIVLLIVIFDKSSSSGSLLLLLLKELLEGTSHWPYKEINLY